MIIHPVAKVNLHLEVVGKRSDGYHNISSIFLRLKLCDQLTIEFDEAKNFSLLYQNPVSWRIDQDLLYKTYNLLQQLTAKPLSLRLQLTKNIPDKAGLGGGSSDAASLLIAVNRHLKLFDANELNKIGKKIGSDLPFFLSQYSAAMVEATGDRITEMPFMKLYIILLKPVEEISTREAFLALSNKNFSYKFTKERLLNSWLRQEFDFYNSFSTVLAPRYPFIELYKEKLYAQGAQFAELSGTGSIVAGYFFNYNEALRAYQKLKGEIYFSLLTETMENE